jgi:hypothetical protein
MPEQEAETIRAINEVQAVGLGSGRECAYAIDRSGNKIDGTVGGEKDTVTITGLITADSFTLVHNHPTSKSLSPEDVAHVIAGNYTHMIAVGHDGTLYRASRTSKTPSALNVASGYVSQEAGLSLTERVFSQVVNDWELYSINHFGEMRRMVSEGRLSNRDANRLHAHLAMTDLAEKYGLEYTMVDPPWKT